MTTRLSPSAPDLIGLALRVEASEGNDLDLFRDAGNLVWGVRIDDRDDYLSEGEPQYSTDNISPKHWTFERLIQEGAFLDAAMLLVPKVCDWLLNSRCNFAQVWERKGIGHGNWECKAATLALALVAAALRARSQDQ